MWPIRKTPLAPPDLLYKSLEQRLVLCSISSEDWMEPSAKHIVGRILRKVHPGAVLLFHDGGGFVHNYGGERSSTVKALGQAIDLLQEQDYRFVTISELLGSGDTLTENNTN